MTTLEVADDGGLATGATVREVYTIHLDDRLWARVEIWRRQHLSHDGWRVQTETHAQMTADADSFFIAGDLRAFERGPCDDTRLAQSPPPRFRVNAGGPAANRSRPCRTVTGGLP